MTYIVEALLVQGKVQYGWAELSNLDVLCEGSHLLKVIWAEGKGSVKQKEQNEGTVNRISLNGGCITTRLVFPGKLWREGKQQSEGRPLLLTEMKKTTHPGRSPGNTSGNNHRRWSICSTSILHRKSTTPHRKEARVRGNSLRDKICEEAVIIDRAATGGRVDDPKVPPQPSSCQTLKSVISI
ncbi:unnamed protein product [Brugia pahangi]|uniref:Uncharacterized protein n=1 Tax=Brugia pahangi TaxID=6280 RepID=A0A0N4T2H3_BRUPA|nr:unnamed protein product [Brugia pahangi]